MEEYVPIDYKKTVKKWWEGLSDEQRTVIISGDRAKQELMWEGTSFRDQLDFYERLHWRFKDDGSIVLPGQEHVPVKKELPPITMDSDTEPKPKPKPKHKVFDDDGLQMPVRYAPTEMGWKAPKKAPEPKPTSLKLSAEINELGEELIEAVEEPVEEVVSKPRKSMPKKVQLSKKPNFDKMKMGELRKYAQEKGVKTGGKKKSDIITELKQAYQ